MLFFDEKFRWTPLSQFSEYSHKKLFLLQLNLIQILFLQNMNPLHIVDFMFGYWVGSFSYYCVKDV